MLSVSDLDQATADLNAAIERVQRLATRSSVDAAGLAVQALRAADRLTATATSVIAQGGFASGTGMPAEMMMRLDGRCTSWDARAIARTASIMSSMPDTASAFEDGLVSWSQVRAIARAVRGCTAAERSAVDRLVGIRALLVADADPDALVGEVEDEVACLRRDRTARREEQAVERSFIVFQPTLEGRCFFYGEGDDASIATVVTALDAHAGALKDERRVAERRYDALVALATSAGGPRSRPRVVAILDADRPERGARLVWSLTGRPPRLSPTGTETLLCDADVLPILFKAGRPIAVGDASSPIPRRIRRAVEARDLGCRFPGCDAPLAWTDVHHILQRSRGGRNVIDNLISLCRRCHRRIHKRSWTVTVDRDGAFVFRRRGRRFTSPTRHPPGG